MDSRIEYDIVACDAFEKCLKSGYIDSSVESDSRFRPGFISNRKEAGANLLSVIKAQLKTCDRFDFAVAFIAESGLQTLVETLNTLRDRGVAGRFLVSTYLNFNSPEAMRKLLEYPNIELRVYQGNMHTKGYFFARGDLNTIIVGSSNLTQGALTCNKEWSVLLHSFQNGEMLKSAQEEFNALWLHPETTAVSLEWIEGYESYREKEARKPKQKPFNILELSGGQSGAPLDGGLSAAKIHPNKMQEQALLSLAELRAQNASRALLISATGTGKTFLSALDVAAAKPARVLFVAHRRRILDASLQSYKRVLGELYTYDIYGAASSGSNATCVFAMVSSLSRHLGDFKRDDFDYIVIDEAHRSAANTYLSVMEYFIPKFYLGMTATPDRTDGYDLYALYNHVIAYRITLQDALENGMLVPFHYFGVADLEIDDQVVDDPRMFMRLASHDRVRHVTQKIEEYSVCKKDRRGLVFCNRNDEAAELSRLFNERGYRTKALSGADSDDARNRAIEMLENGELEYIFTVDIFNEGVDIPSLNQVIMLRRTESAIVFLQQLGRGLRKCNEKEFLLVLDFIGNYQQNYLVPIALSGDRSYNKDNLRAFVKEGSTVIPGASTISFDEVSEKRIFKSLDDGRFAETRLIRSEYEHLKRMLGRIPSLMDFDQNEVMDPLIIFRKFGSYPGFLMKYEKDRLFSFGERKLKYLKFISQKFANGKRREEIVVLQVLVDICFEGRFEEGNRLIESLRMSAEKEGSIARSLSGEFFGSSGQMLAEHTGKYWSLSAGFRSELLDECFRKNVSDLLGFALLRNEKAYMQAYGDTGLVLNAKYTYEEVCRILCWDKSVNAQNIGGYKFDAATNTFPVFINYDKDPGIEASINYEDRFVSDRELIALSKPRRTVESPDIVRLKEWGQNGMRVYLFVRKNKSDGDGGQEFYFLGSMRPTGHFNQMIMPDTTNSVVEITYRLDNPVRPDLYDYFLSSFGESS